MAILNRQKAYSILFLTFDFRPAVLVVYWINYILPQRCWVELLYLNQSRTAIKL